MNNWMLDIETLDQESTSVILSIALVYFKTELPVLIRDLRKQSILVKFDVNEQRKKFKRTVSKDTLDWWKKQPTAVQETSLFPSKKDVSVLDGMEMLSDFFSAHGGTKHSYIYSRGSFDAVITDSLIHVAGLKPLIHFSNYRDVRTALDCLYPKTSKNGYVEIDDENCPDFNSSKLIKHNPIDDCCADIGMMLAGKTQ
jgi:hypothetical protein